MRTLLAFLQFHCPSCNRDFLYPLTRGYRVTYWVIVVLMVAAAIYALMWGRIGFPGILALIASYSLIKDARLRRDVAAAEASATGPGIAAAS